MHLWQIRHIPNLRQTLLSFTLVAAAGIAASVTLFPPIGFALAQTSDTAKEPSEAAGKPSAAAEFLERVRQELPKHRSIKADLTQLVSIGDQQFKVTGHYLSEGQKLRLTYVVDRDQGMKCDMLEICDGKELWTLLEMSDSKRVTHRNIQQILTAAQAKPNMTEATAGVQLGLGGLAALLVSLERTMVFEAIKEDETGGRSRTMIQGRWKKDPFPRDKDGSMPVFAPDVVRLYVDTQSLFPERVLYLKKIPQKKGYKALVSLEFRNVEFDAPVDEKDFVFTIPDGAIPEDVTKFYLDRLTTPESQPPAVN